MLCSRRLFSRISCGRLLRNKLDGWSKSAVSIQKPISDPETSVQWQSHTEYNEHDRREAQQYTAHRTVRSEKARALSV